MIRSYVIVDCDVQSVTELQKVLEAFKELKFIGYATDYNQGLDLILKEKPQIVFIEIDQEKIDAKPTMFELIQEVKKYLTEIPEFIITTKTKEYAFDAISNEVQHYLLKPVPEINIRKALLKIKKDSNARPTIICLKSYSDYHFIDVTEILYLKADNNTTDFFLQNGSVISAYKTLKYFEAKLPSYFKRIHNSYIINTQFVLRINFGKSKCCIKGVSDQIPFSRAYKDNVSQIKEVFADSGIMMN